MTYEDLQPGAVYEVIRPFKDFFDEDFVTGDRLTYIRHNYLPYDGGHTLTFSENVLRLRDGDNDEILNHLANYLRLIKPGPYVPPLKVAQFKQGMTYEVLQPFVDLDRTRFSTGERLTFIDVSHPAGSISMLARFRGKQLRLLPGEEVAEHAERFFRIVEDTWSQDSLPKEPCTK